MRYHNRDLDKYGELYISGTDIGKGPLNHIRSVVRLLEVK